MEINKVTEGLENFVSTDAVSSTLNGPIIYYPCYGVDPKPIES